MSGQLNWDLLDRYLSGSCTREQAEEISTWAAADPAHARELEAARRICTTIAAGADRFDTNREWHAMHERIMRTGHSSRRSRLRFAPRWRAVASIAAGLLLFSAGVAAWYTGVLRRAEPAATAVAMREYTTRKGQRADIMLPDGTRATLNVDSRLRIPARYGATTRDVELDGEAFFDVRHDARAPFRVHTAGAVAEDIGTAFAVRAYPGEQGVTVVVRAGDVALQSRSTASMPATIVAAGQLGRVDASGRVLVQSHADVKSNLAWMQGRLTFRLRPFADVARELERWYDVEITLDDSSLATVPVTVSFTNQSLDEVLAIISQSLDVQYHRDGSRVRLYTTPRSQ
jgi:transmembrane sensor